MWLLLIFVAVPIIEIALFIQVGGLIGLVPTLLIVVVTAILGTALMRHQGLKVLRQLQQELEAGGDPSGPIAHGAMILFAGAMLLTPGFFTDAVGFALLVPAVRDRCIAYAARRVTAQTFSFRAGPSRSTSSTSRSANSETIETEYEIVEESAPSGQRGTSGWTRPES
ncbi:MAG: FxsA family protein [Pseudomonadota bacterium]